MDIESVLPNSDNLSDVASDIALCSTSVPYVQHEALRIRFNLQCTYLDLTKRRYRKMRDECVVHLQARNDAISKMNRQATTFRQSLEYERNALVSQCEWFRTVIIGLTVATSIGWIGAIGSAMFAFGLLG